MDDIKEILERTYTNMKQIDSFFNGEEYQCLIDMTTTTTQQQTVANIILNQVNLIDDSIEFFTGKKEWQRCYDESVKLVCILRDCIDNKYNPA
jgi:hypothetical protein